MICLGKIIYSDKNVYGTFTLYEDHMEFKYKALGMGKAREYDFRYEEIVNFDFISSGTILYKFLHLVVNDGKEYDFYISKKVTDEWTNHLNELLKKESNSNKIETVKTSKQETVKTSKQEDERLNNDDNKNNKYDVNLFLPKGQCEATLIIGDTDLKVESSNEILFIPYTSIISLQKTSAGDIKVIANNNYSFVIRCDNSERLYNDLQEIKESVSHDISSKIKIEDVFGNDMIKAQVNQNKVKIIAVIAIVVAIFLMFRSCGGGGSDAASTISWDIRQQDMALGYGTKYSIGELLSTSCVEDEEDGKGRYIVRCEVSYYPKRNNGAIATDSKMNETIYAVFLRTGKDDFSRLYTSNANDSFKQHVCWGQDASKGVVCID